MAARQTRGRQRIPMRLIQNQDDLYASFSKRRLGLFKKASELSTLCGADVGILVFSPTDNPFSFFSPSMESVIERYMHPDRPLKQAARAVDFYTRSRIEALNKRLDEVTEQKVKLKEYDRQLAEADKQRQRGWWEEAGGVDGLSKEEVREWTAWFNDFKARVENEVAQMQNGGSTSMAAPPPPYYASVADQFGGGQYFGVDMQDQAAAVNMSGVGGGGGGGIAQYLLNSAPLDPFYRQVGRGGGGSGNVFSSVYQCYMSGAGGDMFAGGSSGGGNGQFVFSAAAYGGGGGSGQHFGAMAPPSRSGVPATNFCFTPTPTLTPTPTYNENQSAAGVGVGVGELGVGVGVDEAGTSNSNQGGN